MRLSSKLRPLVMLAILLGFLFLRTQRDPPGNGEICFTSGQTAGTRGLWNLVTLLSSHYWPHPPSTTDFSRPKYQSHQKTENMQPHKHSKMLQIVTLLAGFWSVTKEVRQIFFLTDWFIFKAVPWKTVCGGVEGGGCRGDDAPRPVSLPIGQQNHQQTFLQGLNSYSSLTMCV